MIKRGLIVLLVMGTLPWAEAQEIEDYGGEPEQTSSRQFTPEQAKGIVSSLIAPYNFTEDVRKDPFLHPEILQPPENLPSHGPFMPLQQFDIASLRVRAILWSVRQPRALVETPTGQTYTVSLGERLGSKNGYVALIREGEVVVVETEEVNGETVSSTHVLTIRR